MFKSIFMAGFLGLSLLLAGCDDLNKAVSGKKAEGAPPATVTDTSEKHMALATETAHLILATGGYDMLMDTGTAQGMQVFAANMHGQLGRDLTQEEYAMYEKAFSDSFRETFPAEMWEAPLAEVYAKHFDNNDLAGLLAFYKTPLGEKLLRTQGALSKEGAEMGVKLVEGKQAEFVRAFTEKLSKAHAK